MQNRAVPDRPTPPTPCRIDLLQSALSGLFPPDNQLELMLDRLETRR